MKNKWFLRGLLGFPLGIAIGHIISVLCSLFFGVGTFEPCTPYLIELVGNEINAVILQTMMCGVIGSSFAASSVVWQFDNWSIVKQTGFYFLINGVIMLPIAYLLNWMEHSIMGFIIYLIIFTVYFVVLWLIQYFVWKNSLKKINDKLNSLTDVKEKI